MPVFRLRFFRGGAEERVSRFLSAHQHKLGIHVFLLSREILDTKRKTFVNENMIIEDVNATTAEQPKFSSNCSSPRALSTGSMYSGEIVLLRDKIREIVNFLTAYEVSFIILKFKSLNNVTKLGLHTLQIVCIIRATRTQLSVSGAAVARNASSDKSHIMPSNTRCAAFVRSIIFACVAFPAAQCECRELRSFTSATKLSLHRHIRILGITINILSLFSLSCNSCFLLCFVTV